MESPKAFLNAIWRQVRSPKVGKEELERLDRVRRELPDPVFWLLGKSQSGKTSVIRALTGSSLAEIGDGFRPCTRTAQLYPFPSEEDHFLHFLDTRGLGEVDYDPTEDLQVLENQAHCLIVVIKAMDHAQQSVLTALERITAAHPDWPLIVAQTCLHEGYPASQRRHVEPYPYDQTPLPPPVPDDLARSLLGQRQWFINYNARFVAVDFTLPEDGYQSENHGLDALWSAVEEALPLGLQAMMRERGKSTRDAYFRAAHPHVLSHAAAAGAAAGLPLPMVDVPLLVAIQAKMFYSIASIYGQKVSRQQMAEILGTLGIGFATKMGGRELLKLVPGFGSAMAAAFASAATYALGCTLCSYFNHARQGAVPDAATLGKLYEEEYEEGRRRLAQYIERLAERRKNGA